MDLDFIKYSLNDESIKRFISKLNIIEGVRIEINGDIEELSQQEYKGKRVFIEVTDEEGYSIQSKIDFGVHVNMDIEQEAYCFDVCMDDEGASLLINSKEQIFTEKLRSLLKFGPFSTRYKDILDMAYLTEHLDREKLMASMHVYILDIDSMREKTMEDINNRLDSTFNNNAYLRNINQARRANWLGISVEEAMNKISVYLKE